MKDNGKGEIKLPEAYVFDTGSKDWKTYDVWPPKNVVKESFYLAQDKLTTAAQNDGDFKNSSVILKNQFLLPKISIKKGLRQENT